MIVPVKYISLDNRLLFMNDKKINIAIVEDLKDVAIELSHVINDEEDLVCNQVYFNAEEAIVFLLRNPVDVVLIDIGLPGMSGIEAIIELRSKLPNTEFCMFTVFEDDEKIFSSLKAGAKGYVLKNDEPEMIVHSLRDLSKGGSPMNPLIARKVIDSFSKIHTSKAEVNDELPLSPREKQILELLSKGLLYKEISESLTITIGTVKQHIHKIYHKLQVNNKTEAINLYLNRK